MPKDRDRDLPGTVQRSPAKARRTYRKAHDSAVDSYGEGERAHRTAYSALKHSFEKVGDRWEPKDHKGPSDERAAKGGKAARSGRVGAAGSNGETACAGRDRPSGKWPPRGLPQSTRSLFDRKSPFRRRRRKIGTST